LEFGINGKDERWRNRNGKLEGLSYDAQTALSRWGTSSKLPAIFPFADVTFFGNSFLLKL
jgi:hypothetical protein